MARIKKFKTLNMACFMGLTGVFMGFIFAVLMFLLVLILPLFLSNFGTVFNMISPSLSNLLWYPLLYGTISFLGGLIFTPLTNLILRIVGGIKLDLEIQ